MSTSIRFEYSTALASQAETVTGMSADQRRNLRRLGYLPFTDGRWSRASPLDLAAELVISKLSELGIPPSTSSPIAKSAAVQIVVFALKQPGAIDDPLELRGDEQPIKHDRDFPRRFLIVVGKEEAKFTFSDQGEIDAVAAVVLDLERLGKWLAENLGRPLVKVVREFD